MLVDFRLHRARFLDLARRLHNRPTAERDAELGRYLEESFDSAVRPSVDYLRGGELVEDYEARRTSGMVARFDALSLGNWLTIAEAAGLPHVPASFLGEPGIVELLSLAAGRMKLDESKGLAEARERLEEIGAASPGMRSILRADMAAPAALKASIGSSQEAAAALPDECGPDARGPSAEEQLIALAADPRVLDQLLSVPHERVPLWLRPWVEPRRRAGGDGGAWPCEWRVFVSGGRIVAVSNYYPQAPAEETEWEAICGRVVEASHRLLAALGVLALVPHHPRMIGRPDVAEGQVYCSFDFLEDETGELLLLEAGPGHFRDPPWGAHPCCFGTERRPQGVALGGGRFLEADFAPTFETCDRPNAEPDLESPSP